MIIRGLLFENWHLSDCSTKDRKIDQFLEGIEEEFYRDDLDVEISISAVIQVLSFHISQGEVEKIKKVLPREIGMLWEEICAA